MKIRSPLYRYASPHIVQPIIHPTSIKQNLLISGSGYIDSNIDNLNLEAIENNKIIKCHQPIQTPMSEMNDSKPIFHSVSSTSFDLDQSHIFDVYPLLEDVEKDQLMEEFMKKCHQCFQMCDFRNKQEEEFVEQKSKILTDILNGINKLDIVSMMNDAEYKIFYDFIIQNVIRSTPTPPNIWSAPSSIDFLSDRVEEIGWPHISLCYQIFYAFLSHRKFNFTKCRNQLYKIIQGIIPLFKSPDKRERELLIQVFHGIYRNLPKYRPKIHKAVMSLLVEFWDSTIPLGCSEMLTAFNPVVQGFKVPIHPDNISLLTDYIFPLYRCPQYQYFNSAMDSIISSFISKDPNLIINVFEEMYKYWPITSPQKQILFLNGIETLTEYANYDISRLFVPNICKIISFCFSDFNFCVCERALMLWENDTFMKIIAYNSCISFPLLLPAILKSATSHWCSDVRELAVNAIRVLKGSDPHAFESIGKSIKTIESNSINKVAQHGEIWSQLLKEYKCSTKEKDQLNAKIHSLYHKDSFLPSEKRRESARPLVLNTETKLSKVQITSHSSTIANYKVMVRLSPLSKRANHSYYSVK